MPGLAARDSTLGGGGPRDRGSHALASCDRVHGGRGGDAIARCANATGELARTDVVGKVDAVEIDHTGEHAGRRDSKRIA